MEAVYYVANCALSRLAAVISWRHWRRRVAFAAKYQRAEVGPIKSVVAAVSWWHEAVLSSSVVGEIMWAKYRRRCIVAEIIS